MMIWKVEVEAENWNSALFGMEVIIIWNEMIC